MQMTFPACGEWDGMDFASTPPPVRREDGKEKKMNL